MKKCPTHQIRMVCTDTKYGQRFDCQVPGCDMMCWGNETSTPANQATRDARMEAHRKFDHLWKSGQIERREAYKLLSLFLFLTGKETHIGMFDIKDCKKVIAFAEALPLELLKEKYN